LNLIKTDELIKLIKIEFWLVLSFLQNLLFYMSILIGKLQFK